MVIRLPFESKKTIFKGDYLMTQIPYMRLSLLALIAFGITPHLFPRAREIQGKTFNVEKREVKTFQLMNEIATQRAIRSTCPPPAACPPCPPATPGIYVPTQNPAALPGAFFPSTTTANANVVPPQTTGVIFTAANRATNAASNYKAGSCGGILGLEQFILTTSYGLISFDRSGDRDGNLNVELASFVNADSDFSTFLDSAEIRMRFDQSTNRFIFAMDSFDKSSPVLGPGGFTIGMSDTSGEINANTTWTIVNIFDATLLPNVIGCPADQTNVIEFTRVAVDQNAIYVAINWFAMSNLYFSSSSAYVIQKQSLINGGPAVITAFPDLVGFPGSPVPYRGAGSTLMVVDNFDTNPTFGYLIAQDPDFFGSLIFYRIINPGSTSPTISPQISLDVPATGSYISGTTSAPFLGNLFGVLGNLGVNDDLLQMAHIRNGQLYTVQGILVNSSGIGTPSGDRAGIRWYQFSVNPSGTETATTIPTLIQAGTVWDSSPSNPIWYYMPSIMTNKNGDLVIAGTLSSTSVPTTAFYVGRLASDTLGQLRVGASITDIMYAQGAGTYSRTLGTLSEIGSFPTTFGQRFGYWSYTAIDPLDNLTMWTTQSILVDGLETFVVAQLLAP